MNRFSKSRPALTLVEMLVTIVLCTIAVGVVLPANQKLKDAANRQKNHNNLKQMGLGLNNFDGAYLLLPHSQGLSSGTTTRPAQFHILPYMENEAYYNKYLTKSETDGQVIISYFYDPDRPSSAWTFNGGATVDYAVNGLIFGDNNFNATITFTEGNPKAAINIPVRHPTVTNCTTYSIGTLTSSGRGTSNMIFAGQKRMAIGNYATRDTDMGINGTVTSTQNASGGGGRGTPHARCSNYLAKDPTGNANVNGDWGGPYDNGCVFLFGDGHTATIRYSVSTSAVMSDAMNPVSIGTKGLDELGPGRDDDESTDTSKTTGPSEASPGKPANVEDKAKPGSSNTLIIVALVVVLILSLAFVGFMVYRHQSSKNKD